MVNRHNSDNVRNSARPTQDLKFTQQRTAPGKTVVVDDVITSLANAHENRRVGKRQKAGEPDASHGDQAESKAGQGLDVSGNSGEGDENTL